MFVSHITVIAEQDLIEKEILGVALTRLYWAGWDETGSAYFWIASVFGVIGLLVPPDKRTMLETCHSK